MDSYAHFNKSKRYEIESVYTNNNGYRVIKTNEGTMLYSHYVLRKYLPYVKEAFFVKHLDDDKMNCHISNLNIVASNHSKRWVVRNGKLIIQSVEGKPLWSRKHDSCFICKSTKYAHAAKGLCKSCYMIDYDLNNKRTKTPFKKQTPLKELIYKPEEYLSRESTTFP